MKILLLLILLCTGAAKASPLENLQKVGEARLTVWFWEIYQSSLYTPSGEYKANSYPVALKIDYLRDIKAEDLVDATEEQWQKQGRDKEKVSLWLERVEQIWPDIQEGDELIFLVNENKKGHFYYNQQHIGAIEDETFSSAFLGIWLSPDTQYPELREKLIQRSHK
ncbi:chalcone isomerase family protein [Lacimicrobium alkaliphilum]|uniref:Membrane protein n=1 Tax=Lacimicrobium alkaliphilum TaxID=1526571 RepID=A0ABQ1RF37_9ALTE|nr:chalcone isomerase family protein [Lacimicrobium alkaliphilum]GGD66315.1 membrane protein [Lacimicrobium alkaliphilum]